MCLFSGGRLIKGVFVLSVSNPQSCHRSALCNSPLNCSFTAEMSTFTFWGFEHQDPEILPIGVLFFCRFSFFFISRETKKKKKRGGKKINLSVFAARLAGGEVWVLFFKPQRPPNFHFSLFPPSSSPTLAHIYTHQPLSRPKRPNKEEKTEQN